MTAGDQTPQAPGLSPAGDAVDPDLAARVILVSLPKMGPARARWLLSDRSAPDVVAQLAAGTLRPGESPPRGVTSELVQSWGEAIRSTNLAALVAAQFEAGRHVLGPSHALWPFGEDPEPPVVLFCSGDVELLGSNRLVSIVGTRRCSSVGRRVAHRLGLDLARESVSVVSGLALGIDAASHRGCLDGGGRPVAVVASGLDVVYPEANRALWSDVVNHGLVVSEAPAGSEPQRWRFPARNRLIAALGQGTVIVESHRRGGALITAEEAADRGRPVMSVPGSVLSPSAEGCNGLLIDGATPVRDADDVLSYLGMEAPGAATLVDPVAPPGRRDTSPVATDPPGSATSGLPVGDVLLGRRVMDELANGPASVDELVSATGSGPGDVLNVLSRLVMTGSVAFDGVTVSLSGT